MSVQRFLRDSRAAATALAAAAVTVMTMGGAALVVDHLWLVDQRDTLKAATAAATIAATQEMTKQVTRNPGISDPALRTALESVATRYILLNLGHLPAERFEKAESTLDVRLKVDRSLNIVDVAAAAQMGGTLFTLPAFGGGAEPQMVRVEAAVESVPNPVEVVVALDISESMALCLDGRNCRNWNKENNRLSIVQRAAEKLVDILDPGAHEQVAIGVVPWHTQIRLDPDAVAKWENEAWAVYPDRRRYPVPWYCGFGRDEATCTLPPGEEQILPQPEPEAWEGCLDEDRVSGLQSVAALPGALSGLLERPHDSPFAKGIFHGGYGFAFNCHSEMPRGEFKAQVCYDTAHLSGQSVVSAQYTCHPDNPALLPLSSDRPKIDQAIADLKAIGGRTYSSLGVLWAQRLLSHSWKDVWGNPVHPVDPAVDENTRKAIVLLTDGEDTYCAMGNTSCIGSPLGFSRADACAAAKAAGSEVFVIAAMAPALVSTSFEDDLRECSSETEDSSGTHLFVNITTPDALVAAFADIATQLLVVRRTR